MIETFAPPLPPAYSALRSATEAVGFTMASDVSTGALLRTLAASRPGGALLELGTGTGLATSWLLDGMDPRATLMTVDNDAALVRIAQTHLGDDARVTFVLQDGGRWLESLQAESRTFDLVFADTWAGKYTHLDEALALVRVGGLYVVDDMLPQPSWPPEHAPKVERLVETLAARSDLHLTMMTWSTGLIVAAKVR